VERLLRQSTAHPRAVRSKREIDDLADSELRLATHVRLVAPRQRGCQCPNLVDCHRHAAQDKQRKRAGRGVVTTRKSRGGRLSQAPRRLMSPFPPEGDNRSRDIPEHSDRLGSPYRQSAAAHLEPVRPTGIGPNRASRPRVEITFGRPDELEPGRVDGPALRSGDAHDTVLERLPQRLERGTDELGQLVQQQDASMRQAHLAGPRAPATTHDRGG
jgi:hypothetical protein